MSARGSSLFSQNARINIYTRARLNESAQRRAHMREDEDVIRVYMDGCFDLMHFGHANALRQARAIASQINDEKKCELIVGLVSDEEILRCKGPPVLPEAERVKCVKAVKWVDDVITNVPYELLPEFVEELFSGASLIVVYSLFLSIYIYV